MSWPPGAERVPADRVAPGTEVMTGAAIKVFDRVEQSPGGSMWLVFWQGIEEPTKFQEEPVLIVWPATQPAP